MLVSTRLVIVASAFALAFASSHAHAGCRVLSNGMKQCSPDAPTGINTYPGAPQPNVGTSPGTIYIPPPPKGPGGTSNGTSNCQNVGGHLSCW